MERFVTQDILMAAFLQVRGHHLLELQPDAGGRSVFVFADSPHIGDDAKDFLQDAPVPVRSLARAMARMRNRCREARRGGPMERTDEAKELTVRR